MILDKENQLSDTQTFTANAATENVIDFSADCNSGIGEEMSVIFIPKSDAVVDDETYNLIVQTSIDEAFTAPIELGRRNLTNAEAAAELKAGETGIVIPLAQDTRCEQYLRGFVEVSGSAPDVDLTTFYSPTYGIPAEVRGGYANNSVIS